MKVIKTLIVLTLVFGVVTLNSCKKKDPAPSATITATVDGIATTFNTHAIGAKGTIQGITITTIQGTAANGTSLAITLNGTITAGKTYSSSANSPDDEPLLLLSTPDSDFLNDDSSANLVSVTITAVSSSSIQGTFKGNLVSTNINVGNSGAQNATKVIADGKFNVSF
ncbi:MAG: hypothetical protein JWP37_2695 [Mucilaginibacter sp.]|nr:hypothetical protein [Mucilaginibacter sp.]